MYLEPGLVLTARNQTTTIAPLSKQVRVYWVAPDRVHYQIETYPGSGVFDLRIRETPTERFNDIIAGR